MAKNVYDVLDEIETQGHLEDRREYETDQLKDMYDLTDQEAEDLHYLIRRQFDPTYERPYDHLRKYPKEWVIEYIVESIHSSFDGWDEPHDRVVIERFLDDMMLYLRNYEKALNPTKKGA